MSLSRAAIFDHGRKVSVKPFQFPADYPEGFARETFYVKVMTAKDKGTFEAQFTDAKGKPIRSRGITLRERLTIATLCDEAGALLLNENDLTSLSEIDGRVVGFMAEAAAQANKIADADLEELAKN